MFTTLATGPWLPHQVHLLPVPASRAILPEVEAQIATLWTAGLARTSRLYDGPMCRLESFTATPTQLALNISPTSYKIFYGTNLHNPQLFPRFGPSPLANPIGLSAAVITSDQYFVLGRRNSNVAYHPNRTHPFAGSFEPTDSTPFAGIQRELHEELHLTPGDLHPQTLLGIAADNQLHQPELIFKIPIKKTLAELARTLDPAEHHTIQSLPLTLSALAAAQRRSEFTPIALAALTLLYASLS